MAPRYGSPAQLEWQKFPEPLPIVRLWTRIMLREIIMLPEFRSINGVRSCAWSGARLEAPSSGRAEGPPFAQPVVARECSQRDGE